MCTLPTARLLAPTLALHIHPPYCRPATPLFAFRVRLADPPPKPGSTSPPISAGAWAGPANKPICRRLITHCNRDAHLNLALPAATAFALPVLAAETISVAFTHSRIRAFEPAIPFFGLLIAWSFAPDRHCSQCSSALGLWLSPGPSVCSRFRPV